MAEGKVSLCCFIRFVVWLVGDEKFAHTLTCNSLQNANIIHTWRMGYGTPYLRKSLSFNEKNLI